MHAHTTEIITEATLHGPPRFRLEWLAWRPQCFVHDRRAGRGCRIGDVKSKRRVSALEQARIHRRWRRGALFLPRHPLPSTHRRPTPEKMLRAIWVPRAPGVAPRGACRA